MEVGLLGPVQISDDDATVTVTSAAQATIVALLALNCGRWVSADALIDALWGDDPPPSALSSLRAQISRLRHTAGNRLEGSAAGYRLAITADAVDAHRLDAALSRDPTPSQRHHRDTAPVDDLERRRAEIASALDAWRGEPFGATTSPALAGEAQRLRTRRLDALTELARIDAARGDTDAALAATHQVTSTDPHREPAWVITVDALTTAGRTADALRAYQDAVVALADAGLEPGAELRAAELRALAPEPPAPEVAASPEGDRPSTRATASDQGNNSRPPPRPPAPLSILVGRDHDLAALVEECRRARLVTLTVPGGVGKTRLAIETAQHLADDHRAGALFVPLAGIDAGDAATVDAALAAALGLRASDALDDAGTIDALVVLDNCEHVIDAAAERVHRMLAAGDRLRVLATSRERLGLDGERAWPVTPLPTDGSTNPAADLLIARAGAAAADVDPCDPAVAQLVRALDGLPLAIEMAAARLATRTPAEILDELATSPGALDQRRRDLDQRHLSLDAVISWSEKLLSARHRATLAELSVFAGPVTRADIDGVIDTSALDEPAGTDPKGGAVAIVDDLVAQSLVLADTRVPPTTYRLLATVRRHADRRLASTGRRDDAATRHATWFTHRLAEIDHDATTADEAAARRRYGEIFDELRRAHRWACDHDHDLCADLLVNGHLCAQETLRGELVDWAEESAAAGATDRRIHAVLAAGLATRGRLTDARAHAEIVLDDHTVDRITVYALEGAGDAAVYAGDLQHAVGYARRGIDIATEVGALHYIDLFRVSLALALTYGGDPDGAWAHVDVEPASPRPTSRAWLAYGRGEVATDRDPGLALAELDTAAAIAAEAGNRMVEGVATVSAASLRARAGDPTEALAAFAQLLDRYADTGDRSHQLTTLKNVVVLLDRLGESHAVAAIGASVVDDPASPSYGTEADRLHLALTNSQARLGARFATASTEGRDWTLDQLTSHARDEIARLRGTATDDPRPEPRPERPGR